MTTVLYILSALGVAGIVDVFFFKGKIGVVLSEYLAWAIAHIRDWVR